MAGEDSADKSAYLHSDCFHWMAYTDNVCSLTCFIKSVMFYHRTLHLWLRPPRYHARAHVNGDPRNLWSHLAAKIHQNLLLPLHQSSNPVRFSRNGHLKLSFLRFIIIKSSRVKPSHVYEHPPQAFPRYFTLFYLTQSLFGYRRSSFCPSVAIDSLILYVYHTKLL